MENTAGFYKKVNDDEWLYAPNFVYAKDYTLLKDGYHGPIDGWQWYDEAPQEFVLWQIKSKQ